MEKQRGSLLIEMLVSMALGVFLMYGALQVLLTTKQNYLFRDAASTVEQNGRLSLQLMASDIRMAGYRGCDSNNKSMAVGVSLGGYYQDALLNPNVGVRGWEYVNTGVGASLSSPSNWHGTDSFNGVNWRTGAVDESAKATSGKGSTDFEIARESDVIRLWSVMPYVMNTTAVSSTQITPVSDTMNGFPSGANERLLVVSDCQKSVLVKANNFSSSAVTLADTVPSVLSSFEGSWAGQAMMLNMVQYSLEIPATGGDRPSLYRREMGTDGNFNNKVEVMPSVLNMQILYGENLDGDSAADTYLPADQVVDWEKVVSVRLWLLVETERDFVLQEPQTVRYYGNTYNMPDKRIRKEFTTTVALRNRMVGDD